MTQLTRDYYIMTIDGVCLKIEAASKMDAMTIASNRLGYDSFDEFYDDLNMCEWIDDEHRVLESYSEGHTRTERYSKMTPYHLSQYSSRTFHKTIYDQSLTYEI